MRILFDHDVPRPLRRNLTGHEVDTARQRGWEELSNGDLLNVAEREGYEVFITADQKIPYQQNLDRRSFGVVILLSNTGHKLERTPPQFKAPWKGYSPGN